MNEFQFKCEKALEELGMHPAINMHSGDFMNVNVFWRMYQVCKNGVAKDFPIISDDNVVVRIYNDNPEYKKYADKYSDDGESVLYVPYFDYYGYKWVFDRFEYWMEIDMFKYIGNSFDIKETSDLNNWRRYHGNSFIGSSLEECISNAYDYVVENYGKFKYEDFLTDEEKNNHKSERMFFHEEINIDGKKMFQLIDNSKYINVSDVEINKRWWGWFRKTEYYNKNWSGE